MADELEKNDADVVLSVLKQNVPVIRDKIKRLEDNIEISSDYTAHLWDMDEKDAQQRQGERIFVVEKEWKCLKGDNKQMREQILEQTNDILKLRHDL